LISKRSEIETITRLSKGHLDLFIRLTPNVSSDEVTGILSTADNDMRLAMKVRAVPQKGRANSAAIAFLAKKLGVPKSKISIASGSTSRLKTLRIEDDPQAILQKLEQLIA
jgi:uncharacterized protein (TIGR00251 family)